MFDTSIWVGGDSRTPRRRDHRPLRAQFFEIDVRRRPDHPVVAHVIGPVDLLTAPELRLCVEDNVGDRRGLVLDLSRVNFLAASGLSVLTDTEERANRERLAWALVVNSRPVIRPLDLLGLRQRLPTYHSVLAAISAVAGVVGCCH
ncbi:STAS domain-containing protein [Actinophytocola sediminis]